LSKPPTAVWIWGAIGSREAVLAVCERFYVEFAQAEDYLLARQLGQAEEWTNHCLQLKPLKTALSLSLFIIGLWTNYKHRFSASAPLVIDHRPNPKAHITIAVW
jgi:hypothetical protein